MYHVAICYLKKALMMAWDLFDSVTELAYYEKLAILYFNVGDSERSGKYKKRAFYSQLEEENFLDVRVQMVSKKAKQHDQVT